MIERDSLLKDGRSPFVLSLHYYDCVCVNGDGSANLFQYGRRNNSLNIVELMFVLICISKRERGDTTLYLQQQAIMDQLSTLKS